MLRALAISKLYALVRGTRNNLENVIFITYILYSVCKRKMIQKIINWICLLFRTPQSKLYFK